MFNYSPASGRLSDEKLKLIIIFSYSLVYVSLLDVCVSWLQC